MGTHQVRWMALDHKYGSWFDYMEPHVKPTAHPPPFPPSFPPRVSSSPSACLSVSRPVVHVHALARPCVLSLAAVPREFYPESEMRLFSYQSPIVFARRVSSGAYKTPGETIPRDLRAPSYVSSTINAIDLRERRKRQREGSSWKFASGVSSVSCRDLR